MRACECGACGSALLRGLFEFLPKPGAVLSEEKRRKWLSLAETALDLEYPSESPEPEVADAPAERRTLPALEPPEEVEELEARPAAFNAKLAQRKKKGRPRKPSVERGAGAVPSERPKVNSKDLILALLKDAPANGLKIKEMVPLAESDSRFDVSGYRDLHGAISHQIKRMEIAGDVAIVDMEGLANRYALPR